MAARSETRALVTGATGFIGSHLIARLCELGIRPYALCRKSSKLDHLAPLVEGRDYYRIEGDLGDAAALERACASVKPDYVFHLAGVIAARGRDGYFAGNADGTERLVRALVAPEGRTHLKRMVYVSSLAAGGPARRTGGVPRSESDEDAPVSAYGESKREGELRLKRIWEETFAGNAEGASATPSYVVVRPPMVYGPKDSGLFVVIKTVASGFVPILPGEERGEKIYSIIHVEDLVEAIVRAAGLADFAKGIATFPGQTGDTFYVSGGEHPYLEFLGAIEAGVGRRARKLNVPKPLLIALAHASGFWERWSEKPQMLNPDKLHEILPNRWTCSNARAKEILGFSPKITLREGMQMTVHWYRSAGWIK